MARKSAYIHIGLPKTGTTSIQRFLRIHEPELRSHGYLNPGARFHAMFGILAHHVPFLNAVSNKIIQALPGADLASQKKTVEAAFELVRSDTQFKAIVLSHETLSMQVRKWDFNYLRELTKGMHVRFIIYSRFTDEWIELLYHQNIWARVHPSRAPFYDRPLRNIDEGRTVKLMREFGMRAIANLIGEELENATIAVRSYDTDRDRDSLISGFWSELDLPPLARPLETNGVRLNLGHPAAHTALLQLLQSKHFGLEKLKPIAAALKSRADRQIRFERMVHQNFRFLSEENVTKARTQYRLDAHGFPQLPPQQPYIEQHTIRCLPVEDAVAMLDWLKADISDGIFGEAVALCYS